jgi:hypothetical protein
LIKKQTKDRAETKKNISPDDRVRVPEVFLELRLIGYGISILKTSTSLVAFDHE